MEPRFEQRQAFTVVGMKYRGKNENEEIPQLWEEFWPRHGDIKHRATPNESYGVEDNFDMQSGEFDYIAGLDVTEASDIPEGMTVIEVPAQTYAVFDCTLPTIIETVHYVYDEWLPNSDYRRGKGPEFELYDKRFDPEGGKLTMSYYVPVLEK